MTNVNGDDPSPPKQSLTEKVNKRAARVEEVLKDKGLPQPQKRDIDIYINMSRAEIASYAPEDLEEMAFEIYAYGYYLQDLINQYAAKADVLLKEINRIVGGRLISEFNVPYSSQHERWLLAVNSDDAVQKMWSEHADFQIAITRLQYLGARLEKIADVMMRMKRFKER